MKNRTFYIKAIWDEDAGVFVSESDIVGLHIEAETLEEFERIMRDNATDFIVENHIKPKEIAQKRIKDLIPTIIWQGGNKNAAVA
ncbi:MULTISPECIES: DUF1902 domain-containing protein [Roseovarius]|uniref:DUF1902 domain-containing protein n=1 Tax=Roseovarius TaxID=74030 RepID=UPI00273DE10F|nr:MULTISPECIES: DUF1902 domain-containing protein [unclassified Roseovarius]